MRRPNAASPCDCASLTDSRAGVISETRASIALTSVGTVSLSTERSGR